MSEPKAGSTDVASDELKPWPLNGYAPGGYHCKCHECDKTFVGDKRATICLECAVILSKRARLSRAPFAEGVARPADGPAPVAADFGDHLANLSYYGNHCLDKGSELRRAVLWAVEALTHPVPAEGPAGEAGDLIERLNSVTHNAVAMAICQEAAARLAALKREIDDLKREKVALLAARAEIDMELADAQSALSTARQMRRASKARASALHERVGELEQERDAAAFAGSKNWKEQCDIWATAAKNAEARASALQRRVEELTGLLDTARYAAGDLFSPSLRAEIDAALAARVHAALTLPEKGEKP